MTDIAYAMLDASLADPRDCETLISTALGVLRETIGADSAGFYRHTYGGMTTALLIDPAPLWKAIPAPELPTATACAIHPGVRHLIGRRATTPFEITDLISEREWLSSELGSAMRPEWGRNHQLALPLDDASASTRYVWIVGREQTGFSAADRDVATAVQPVLDALTRRYAANPGSDPRRDAFAELTPRELIVAALMLGNEPTAVIARRLAIAERTVHKHTERIYRKLRIHDRHELRALGHDTAP